MKIVVALLFLCVAEIWLRPALAKPRVRFDSDIVAAKAPIKQIEAPDFRILEYKTCSKDACSLDVRCIENNRQDLLEKRWERCNHQIDYLNSQKDFGSKYKENAKYFYCAAIRSCTSPTKPVATGTLERDPKGAQRPSSARIERPACRVPVGLSTNLSERIGCRSGVCPDINVAFYANYAATVSDRTEFVRLAQEASKTYGGLGLNGKNEIDLGFPVPVDSQSCVVDFVKTVSELFKKQGNVVKVSSIALFSHGLHYALGLDARKRFSSRHSLHVPPCGEENVSNFVEALHDFLSDKNAKFLLFACNAGGEGDEQKCNVKPNWRPLTGSGQGKNSLAQRLAKYLRVRHPHITVTVMAHTAPAHVSDNPWMIVFDGQDEAGKPVFDLTYDPLMESESKRRRPWPKVAGAGSVKGEPLKDMWTHWRCSVSPDSCNKCADKDCDVCEELLCQQKVLKYPPPRYDPIRMGLELFYRFENAAKEIRDNWKRMRDEQKDGQPAVSPPSPPSGSKS